MNYMLHVTSNYRSSDYQHINLKGGNFNVVNNYILDCIVCCFNCQEHYRYNLDTQKEITRIVRKGGDPSQVIYIIPHNEWFVKSFLHKIIKNSITKEK